jgi:penicillin G amidase
MQGLEGPVDVFRDTLGVPHVRAGSIHDAFFAQGFVHAQDRLWHMEYDRRRAEGRLAECCGTQAVTMDTFVRRLGLDAAARADHARFDAETCAATEAYAAGVNAFIEQGVWPVEFRLLDLVPEPWEPWHCGAVFKVRHVLMGVMDPKLWRARLLRTLGVDATLLAASAGGSRATLIVPVGGETRVEVGADELLPAALAMGAPSSEGSNSWVLHGSRTASGLPLLAGDSHRTLEVPNVYHQNHIACPAFDVIGLSMPGVPGMSHFGHNAHVAWCVTHGMADTQDLWVERFDGQGNYEFRGDWLPTERRTEVIEVRGATPVEVDVTRTHHGPVVVGDPASRTAITMRWTGTDIPNLTLPAAISSLQARSVEDLDATPFPPRAPG